MTTYCGSRLLGVQSRNCFSRLSTITDYASIFFQQQRIVSRSIQFNQTRRYAKKKVKHLKKKQRVTFQESLASGRYDIDRVYKQKSKVAVELARRGNIIVPPSIDLAHFSKLLNVHLDDLIETMYDLGFEDSVPESILDFETASLVATEFGFETSLEDSSKDLNPAPISDGTSAWPSRAPFVSIMGHVDHGKTTILDYLRKSSIVATEHGGITQRIGAFSVALSSGKKITFLDTPGHAAFLKMRERGANITDIVVLVVAADDSVMPQTIEAIRHAKKANVPIIVAINKIDKPNVNLEKIYQDLSLQEVYVEEYGGDTQVVKVSGLTGQGINELEDAIITLSEILDNRATADGNAEGWVVESEVKKGRGNIATLVVRRGTVKPSSILVAGFSFAKVRSIRNEFGDSLKSAGPGTPIEVDGWRSLPEAGDEVLQANSEQHAQSVIEYRQQKARHVKEAQDIKVINERRKQDKFRILQQQKEQQVNRGSNNIQRFMVSEENNGDKKYQSFIIKADVSGSAEALKDATEAIGNQKVGSRVIYADVGTLAESDIDRAEVAQAEILCFNIKPDKDVLGIAEKRGIKVSIDNVIYRLIEKVTDAVVGLLPPLIETRVLGTAEIRDLFVINLKKSTAKIAGCRVTNGSIKLNEPVKVLRDSKVIFEGKIESLKHGKNDVMEIGKGKECGLTFVGWDGFQNNDVIQSLEEVQQKQHL
ncbi:hypothetical protein V1514DRAFT_318121 [Lipomyces japonicus]|uniref:uncharacterized protein n=1 Tax=Lipomyces japonicus TaxID=56871 RepID=UPI0034CD99A9